LPNAHAVCFPYGTVNAAICERFIPGYKSPNACDAIAASPFPDSDNEVERAQHPMQAKTCTSHFPRNATVASNHLRGNSRLLLNVDRSLANPRI
jgi:hypothetical protein